MLCFNTGCVHAETQGKIKHNNTGSPRSLGRVNQGHFVAWQPAGNRLLLILENPSIPFLPNVPP
jgi:hypothetical protein